ncbi:MAG: hypothetical protein AB7T06_19810 [Kofleriaceae bacterium]
MRPLVLILSLVAFLGSAMAKPSDWADVIERPGDRSKLPRASENAPQVVTNAKSSKAKKAAPAKKKAKAKKASRRGKAKKSRR